MLKKKKSDKAEVVTPKRSSKRVSVSVKYRSHGCFDKNVTIAIKPVKKHYKI